MSKKLKQLTMCLILVLSLCVTVSTVPGGTIVSAAAKKATLKVGKTFVSGKFRYKVTSLKGKKGTASLIGVKSKSVTSVTVPKTVKTNGYKLTVTEIGDNAFKNCKKLTSVTTNTEIKAIGNNVFKGCKKLKKINITSKKLDSVGSKALNGVGSNVDIKTADSSSYEKLVGGDTQVSAQAASQASAQATPQTSTQAAPQASTKATPQTSAQAAPQASTKATPQASTKPSSQTSASTASSAPASSTASESSAQHEHSYTGWVVTAEPTCTQAGTKTRNCSVCGASETETIAATGHNLLMHAAKAATCTKAGAGTYMTCTRCDYATTPAVVPALGHNYTNYRSNGDATCTEDGTETGSCSRCGLSDTRTANGSALGHDYTIITYNDDATCTENGTETVECDRCGSSYTRTRYGSSLGHDYTDYVYNNDATCQEDGTETRTCNRCQHKDTRTKENSKTEHDWNTEVLSDPTCKAPGYEKLTCKTCGTSKFSSIPALPHTLEDTGTTPATCTDRAKHSFRCSVCGQIFFRYEGSAPTGHNYSKDYTVDVPATCTRRGSESRHCLNEGCTSTIGKREIPVTEHKKATAVTREATCVQYGETTTYCVDCGKIFSTQVIPAGGHAYGEEHLLNEATCTTDEVWAKECKTCGFQMTRVVSGTMTGHDWDVEHAVVSGEVDCTTGGTKTTTCKKCGKTMTEYIPKGDHKWSDTLEDPFVASTDGQKVQKESISTVDICPGIGGKGSTKESVTVYLKKKTCEVCGTTELDTYTKDGSGNFIPFTGTTKNFGGHKWTEDTDAKTAICEICRRHAPGYDPKWNISVETTPGEGFYREVWYVFYLDEKGGISSNSIIGTNMTLEKTAPEKKGYRFVGWFDAYTDAQVTATSEAQANQGESNGSKGAWVEGSTLKCNWRATERTFTAKYELADTASAEISQQNVSPTQEELQNATDYGMINLHPENSVSAPSAVDSGNTSGTQEDIVEEPHLDHDGVESAHTDEEVHDLHHGS